MSTNQLRAQGLFAGSGRETPFRLAMRD